MSNPIYDAMGRQAMPGNPLYMMQQFNQFRRNFNGDPKAIVQNMLNTGRMSQAQFNQLAQMANQFQKMMK